MPRITRKRWKCGRCGHEFDMKPEQPNGPDRCPSNKCRSPYWNKKRVLPTRTPALAKESDPLSLNDSSIKPDEPKPWPCCQGWGVHDITCSKYGQPKVKP